MRAEDTLYMMQALELGDLGWGRVHPNPMVGAVVVRDGAVVGTGAHREYGEDHAEVEALRQAGDAARGATLYVTLEPCAHQGKTPACTDAIRQAGIERVVVAAADPHPEAAGGADRLRDAGIRVDVGVLAQEAEDRNALFLRPLRTGRPFVALKFGLSLDARIAAAAGERTRVTGSESEVRVHELRRGFDAILVGARTARVDDPSLTVRHASPPRIQPRRVVADADATLPPDGVLARTARDTPVTVLSAPSAPEDRVATLAAAGVTVERVAGAELGVDIAAGLDTLWERGVRTVLCEGGGRLAAALFAADRVDRLYLFQAPVLFGADGVPAFPGRARFEGRRVAVERVGADTLTVIDRRR